MQMTLRRTSFALCFSLVSLAVGVAGQFSWETGNATSNWNSAANWGGPLGQYPDDNTDSAAIGVDHTGTSPILNAGNVTIGSLSIFSGGDLATGNGSNNYALTVQSSNFQPGDTNIAGNGSTLTVYQSPVANDFDTDSLFIFQGSLILRQGAKVQVDGELATDSGATILGNGIIELNGGEIFHNDGALIAALGGTLTVQRTGTERINLDGRNGTGALIADSDSRLIIDMPNTGPNFNGLITIQPDAEIRINDNWILQSQIDFNGGAFGTATQSGNRTTYEGTVNINSGVAVLAAATTTIRSSANVTLGIRTGIQFDGPTTIEDPNSLAVGYRARFIVNDVVKIGQGTGIFDWNGVSHASTTEVNPEAELRIDVGNIDGPDNRFEGTLRLNSGQSDVRTSQGQWEMAGLLTLNNTNGNLPGLLTGDPMHVTGSISTFGDGRSSIRAPVFFGRDSHVHVQEGADLQLEGETIIHGGTWTGEGTVDLNANFTSVTAATTIDMPNGAFEITLGDIGFPSDLTLDNALTINAASVGVGPLNIIAADLTINGAAGRLDVRLTDPSASYQIFSGDVVLNGPTNGLTGLHLAGSDIMLKTALSVTGNSTSHSRIDFTDGASVGISQDATFNLASGTHASPNVIRAGVDFEGDGELVVPTGAHLALDNGATVEGFINVNGGTLQVGTTNGAIATVDELDFDPSGTLQLNIDGTVPGIEYDTLMIQTGAQVHGTLEILVNALGGSYADPVEPGTFNEFALLQGPNNSISFAEFVYNGMALNQTSASADELRYHAVDGLFRILKSERLAHRLVNYRALPGDANGDGVVDGTDFLIWNDHKFTSGTDWLTGDFNGDGTTDGADFLLWNEYKFTSVNFGSLVVPENVATLHLFASIGIVLLDRRLRTTRSRKRVAFS